LSALGAEPHWSSLPSRIIGSGTDRLILPPPLPIEDRAQIEIDQLAPSRTLPPWLGKLVPDF
jgi:hypothetical protein